MRVAEPAAAGPDRLDAATITEILTLGEISVTGRISDASNLTLLGAVELDGAALTCVYKPIRGERPLWDFPDGTLAGREVAARRVAVAAGWDCVPTTVLRPGPFGEGMVQVWIDTPDDAPELVDLVAARSVPPGWLPVLRAVDRDGSDVVLAHADDPDLAVLAGFDLVINNADRKGSHVLSPRDGQVYGVDHGLAFHVENKLRTILWGWSGQPLPDRVVEGLDRLTTSLRGELATDLEQYLSVTEIGILTRRVGRLRRYPEYPVTPRNRTPIPWPPL